MRMARKISRLLEQHVREGRSAVRRWLEQNYDEIQPLLAVGRRPWTALAKTAAVSGLPGLRPPTLRKAWERLEEARAKLAPAAAAAAVATSLAHPTSERQPAPIKPLVVNPGRSVDPVEAPAPPRKRVQLRSAKPLAANEAPTLDGSTLPRPLHPNLKYGD
jgi:hypothetical protein